MGRIADASGKHHYQVSESMLERKFVLIEVSIIGQFEKLIFFFSLRPNQEKTYLHITPGREIEGFI